MYEASEERLVDRVLINLHSGILDKAAFSMRPRYLAEFYRTIRLIEDKISVTKERERIELETRARRGGRVELREVLELSGATRRGQRRGR